MDGLSNISIDGQKMVIDGYYMVIIYIICPDDWQLIQKICPDDWQLIQKN